MYIFRPIPLTTCEEKWLLFNALDVNAYAPPAYDPAEWNPNSTYALESTVSYKGYDFVSLKDNNSDDPSKNFMGRLPRPDDTIFGYGTNSWVRKGVTNKYKCFLPQSAGFTESSGNLGAKIILTQLAADIDAVLAPSEMLYMLCSGVIGASMALKQYSFYNTTRNSRTIPITGTGAFSEIDYLTNPELPSKAISVLYGIHGGTGADGNINITDSTEFTISGDSSSFVGGTTSFVENALVGRLSKIGNTQWSNHKFGVNDRSKIVTDDWGVMSLSKRRVSRTIDSEVIITPKSGETIAERLTLLNKFLLYIRGTVNVFIPNNTEITFGEEFSVDILPYRDCVTGLLKTFKFSEISRKKAKLSLSVESIPTAYEPEFPITPP